MKTTKLISNDSIIIIKMSQRLGMADGRCLTVYTSERLLNDYIMKQNNIGYQDNYSYRRLLQSQGPQVMQMIQSQQRTGPPQQQSNHVNMCQSCDTPLLKVPGIY